MILLITLIIVASMFLLTGLAGRSALKESRYAFLNSMINREKEELLGPRILALLREGDLPSLVNFLTERGLIRRGKTLSFEDLQESELRISREYLERYNRLLPYLPDDLRSFFQSLRVLRDIRNLEVLAAHIDGRIPKEELIRLLEIGGTIEIPLLLRIGESNSLRHFIEEAARQLPHGFHLTFEGGEDFLAVVRKLNLAAAVFLQREVERIGSPEVYEAFTHLALTFDARNINIIARLKSEGVPADEIEEWIIPLGEMIDPATLNDLLETVDYADFLRALRETHFGRKALRDLNGTIDPEELEHTSLEFIYSTLSSNLEDKDTVRVWKFLFLLEHEERMIREGLTTLKSLPRGGW